MKETIDAISGFYERDGTAEIRTEDSLDRFRETGKYRGTFLAPGALCRGHAGRVPRWTPEKRCSCAFSTT